MRVLLVTWRFSITGGAEFVAHRRALILTQAGHEVYVLSSDEIENASSGYAECDNIHFFKVPGMQTSLSIPDGNSKFMLDVVREVKPDVMDTHVVGHLQDVASWKEICRTVPVVFTIHTHGATCPGYFRLLRRSDKICTRDFGLHCVISTYRQGCGMPGHRLVDCWVGTWRNRRIFRLAAKLIVLNDFMAGTLSKARFCKKDICIVPPSIDRQTNDDSTPKDNGTAKVLYVGRSSSEKGLDLLLQALMLIKMPYQVIIAGGLSHPTIRKMVQGSRLEEKIKFTGWISHDELETLYRQARVLAFPSHCQETFGIVGLEAASHSLPVVAFNVGGVSSWLWDGETGYLVPPFDVKAFAERLEKILGDRSIAVKMGNQGRERVETEHSAERHYQALIITYQEAIASQTSKKTRTHIDG